MSSPDRARALQHGEGARDDASGPPFARPRTRTALRAATVATALLAAGGSADRQRHRPPTAQRLQDLRDGVQLRPGTVSGSRPTVSDGTGSEDGLVTHGSLNAPGSSSRQDARVDELLALPVRRRRRTLGPVPDRDHLPGQRHAWPAPPRRHGAPRPRRAHRVRAREQRHGHALPLRRHHPADPARNVDLAPQAAHRRDRRRVDRQPSRQVPHRPRRRDGPRERAARTSATGSAAATSTGAAIRGYVVLNAQQNRMYRAGFGSGVTRGTLLLHEIGHVVGLGPRVAPHAGHVPDGPSPRSRRSTAPATGPASSALGISAGCLNVPADARSRPVLSPLVAVG